MLISGLTVITAMAGLYFAGDPEFTGLATGSILVVAMAMLGSITVLPAMLSKVGDGIDRGRIPFLGKRMQRRTESRVWGASCAPSCGTRWSPRSLPPACSSPWPSRPWACTPRSRASSSSRDADHADVAKMQKAFPGTADPGRSWSRPTTSTRPRSRPRSRPRVDQAQASDSFKAGISIDQSENGEVADHQRAARRQGQRQQVVRRARELRDEIVPATVGKLKGAEVVVGGNAAKSKDYNDLVKGSAPIVFAFVLTLAFLLLLVTFRSIIVPIKAIVLNLLSVGASYGVLTLIFQHGWLHKQLGFETPGFVVAWLPLFLFVILFGLSMDYHVYILSRVREGFDKRHVDGGRRDPRDQADRRCRDQRRVRDGRRVRDLRNAQHHRLQDARRRPRPRDLHRRHDRPRGAPARDDEAPRRPQLVPAEQAQLAAPASTTRAASTSSPSATA